jgi:pimeloyl-ACP methyl ester carboxylesterase
VTIPFISVRKEPSGGPVAPEASTDGFELTSSRIVILIHGYNNSQNAALKSYESFLNNSGLGKTTLIGNACGFLWPGDRGGLLAMFSYPWEITPAKESAAVLHQFLVKQVAPGGWPLEVVLVCHSLGNRLGLELVNQNPTSGKLKYKAGCFMAAAVPVFKVEDGGELHAAAEAVDRTAVLYSEDDIILHYAFPLGQTLAGDGEGFFPRAVGRFGQPNAGLWTQTNDMGQFDFNHWNYWDHQESADAVAAFLGLARERNTPAVVIATRETAVQSVPEERNIQGRGIQARVLV